MTHSHASPVDEPDAPSPARAARGGSGRSAEGRRVMRNTALLGAGNLVRVAVGLATTLLITDQLGTDYGLLLGAQRYVDFFRNIAMFGLNAILVRGLASGREEAGELFGSLLALRGVLCAVFAAATLGSAVATGYLPGHLWLLALFVAVGLGLVGVETMTACSEAYERMDRTATLPVTRSLLMLAGAVLVRWLGGGLLEIALVFLATQLLQVALIVNLSRDVLRQMRLRVRRARVLRLLREGPHYMAIGFAYAALRSASVMILTRFSTPEEASMFGAALNFIDVLFLVPLLAQRAFLPVFSREGRSANEVGRDGLHVFSAVLTPSALGLALLCDGAVALYPSGEFAAAAPVLRILALGIACSGLSSVCTTYLTGRGRVGSILRAYALALPVQIAGGLLFVGEHGAMGVAAATVAAQLLMCASNLLAASRLGMLVPARALLRHALAAGLMGIAIWPARGLFVALPAALGALVYAGALLAISPASSLERRGLALAWARLRGGAARQPVAPAGR
jgi:O-antigen/teichoic acid export membrane protein